MLFEHFNFIRILFILSLVSSGLYGQRMTVSRHIEQNVDEGTGSIFARAWTHTIPHDVNEWAIAEAYVNIQTSVGSTIINQSSTWDNCGSGCADITLYSQVSVLGAEYQTCSDHLGRVRDGLNTYSESYAESTGFNVPLPPSVTLNSINAQGGSDIIFSYGISSPVFYSMQVSYGSSHVVSSDYHVSNIAFAIDRSSLAGQSTVVKFYGTMYGQTFSYNSCPVTSYLHSEPVATNESVVLVPTKSAPIAVSVSHSAGLSYRSVQYCQEPVGIASHYTIDQPIAWSALDTSANNASSPRNMDEFYTQENVTFPVWGTMLMNSNGSQLPTRQSRSLSIGYSWFEWGAGVRVANGSIGFDAPAGLYLTSIGGFDFIFQQ